MRLPRLAARGGALLTLLLALLLVRPAAAESAPRGAMVRPTAVATTANDIRDIRGPYPLPSPWRVPLIVGAGLALLAGGYALWRWRRGQAKVEAGLAPHERALARLAAAREMMQPDQARVFSIEVSQTVREFIEARYAVDAPHRTTDEFLRELATSRESVLAAHRKPLAEFLAACDLAKFGGFKLSHAEMERLWATARHFILAAAPPAPVSPQPTSGSPQAGSSSHGPVPSA